MGPADSLRPWWHRAKNKPDSIAGPGGLQERMSVGAVLAHTVKGQLVRSHFEAFVGQLERLDFFLAVEQDVVDPVAGFADKMLMALDQRIEVLRAPAHEHLQLLIRDQLLQVAIDRPETDVRQFFSDPVVNLIGGRVRLVVPDRVPDDFCASGVSTVRAW